MPTNARAQRDSPTGIVDTLSSPNTRPNALLRKVTFTGLLIFFDRGSIYQLAVGIQLSAFFTALAVYFRPYVVHFNNNLYVVANFAVLVTFNIGVLLSDRIDKRREQSWVQDQLYLDVGLVLANCVAPSAVVVYEGYRQVGRDEKKEAAKEVAKEKAEEVVSDQFLKFANPLAGD
jgi:hypothetical protein